VYADEINPSTVQTGGVYTPLASNMVSSVGTYGSRKRESTKHKPGRSPAVGRTGRMGCGHSHTYRVHHYRYYRAGCTRIGDDTVARYSHCRRFLAQCRLSGNAGLQHSFNRTASRNKLGGNSVAARIFDTQPVTARTLESRCAE
jgi:hypothetical protein